MDAKTHTCTCTHICTHTHLCVYTCTRMHDSYPPGYISDFFNTGRVPADWTTAFVTPIFKKGSHTLPSNYLLVSLTCITSKIFERVIACNIYNEALRNILYDLQYGFRQGRSCRTQLISLLDDLTLNYDRSLQTDLIITDFAKAFDVVPHRRL